MWQSNKERGLKLMEETKMMVDVRCPQCLNKMKAIICGKDEIKGRCPVCKAVFFQKRHNAKEVRIRIINQ